MRWKDRSHRSLRNGSGFRQQRQRRCVDGVRHHRRSGTAPALGSEHGGKCDGKIVRIDPSGTVQDFVSSGKDGVWMVFGITVDPVRRLLWAVSMAEKVMERYSIADENATG